MAEKKNVFSTSIGTENVVDRIVKQITDKIISGDLKPGDKLPTEPDLCQAFQVGRNSVREAIKILCAYGILYIKRAEGTFVNDKYSHKMLDPMLYGILLQGNFADDIITLRKVLDTGILHSVIHTVSPEQIQRLYKHLDTMKKLLSDAFLDFDALFQADVNFHSEITSFTKNDMLFSMYSYVDRITHPSRDHALKIILDGDEKEAFIQLHQKLITIIETKQLDEIDEVLNNHYKFWKQEV